MLNKKGTKYVWRNVRDWGLSYLSSFLTPQKMFSFLDRLYLFFLFLVSLLFPSFSLSFLPLSEFSLIAAVREQYRQGDLLAVLAGSFASFINSFFCGRCFLPAGCGRVVIFISFLPSLNCVAVPSVLRVLLWLTLLEASSRCLRSPLLSRDVPVCVLLSPFDLFCCAPSYPNSCVFISYFL